MEEHHLLSRDVQRQLMDMMWYDYGQLIEEVQMRISEYAAKE